MDVERGDNKAIEIRGYIFLGYSGVRVPSV